MYALAGFKVMKRIDFCAGHRLVRYEGKCKHLHGHTYTAELCFIGILDTTGFVIDFNEITHKVKKWIDENWDHGVFVSDEDTKLLDFLQDNAERHYIIKGNPTSEHIARELFNVVNSVMASVLIDGTKRLQYVRIWESPSSFAEHFQELVQPS